MLPKKLRLSHKQIYFVLQNGASVFSETLQLKYCRVPDPLSQFAIIVSGKIAKKAVFRNRIKRCLRSSLFSAQQRLNLHIHGVILVKKMPDSISGEFYLQEVEKLFKQIQYI